MIAMGLALVVLAPAGVAPSTTKTTAVACETVLTGTACAKSTLDAGPPDCNPGHSCVVSSTLTLQMLGLPACGSAWSDDTDDVNSLCPDLAGLYGPASGSRVEYQTDKPFTAFIHFGVSVSGPGGLGYGDAKGSLPIVIPAYTPDQEDVADDIDSPV
ncbi:MAG: hypothetical protein LC620_07935, partial [Halobacteriales archaeon]|nr:hypothetical protein [Halobacteriales archaeon]